MNWKWRGKKQQCQNLHERTELDPAGLGGLWTEISTQNLQNMEYKFQLLHRERSGFQHSFKLSQGYGRADPETYTLLNDFVRGFEGEITSSRVEN
jgi:hypothetical protein